jgi:hypothetical protein
VRPYTFGQCAISTASPLKPPSWLSFHPRAIPVILNTQEECDVWVRAPWMRRKQCSGLCQTTRCRSLHGGDKEDPAAACGMSSAYSLPYSTRPGDDPGARHVGCELPFHAVRAGVSFGISYPDRIGTEVKARCDRAGQIARSCRPGPAEVCRSSFPRSDEQG